MFGVTLITTLINLIMGIAETIISLRIILKLLGANTTSNFVAWIYNTSQPLIAPFMGMFPNPNLVYGIVIEFNSLFALIIYAIAGYILVEILHAIDASAHHHNSHKN